MGFQLIRAIKKNLFKFLLTHALLNEDFLLCWNQWLISVKTLSQTSASTELQKRRVPEPVFLWSQTGSQQPSFQLFQWLLDLLTVRVCNPFPLSSHLIPSGNAPHITSFSSGSIKCVSYIGVFLQCSWRRQKVQPQDSEGCWKNREKTREKE